MRTTTRSSVDLWVMSRKGGRKELRPILLSYWPPGHSIGPVEERILVAIARMETATLNAVSRNEPV